MCRRAPVELSIIHVDVEIGEKSALRPYPFDPFKRPVEMGMGRMRPVAHGVDDQHVGAAHQRKGFFRHSHDVVHIEDVAEPEAK